MVMSETDQVVNYRHTYCYYCCCDDIVVTLIIIIIIINGKDCNLNRDIIMIIWIDHNDDKKKICLSLILIITPSLIIWSLSLYYSSAYLIPHSSPSIVVVVNVVVVCNMKCCWLLYIDTIDQHKLASKICRPLAIDTISLPSSLALIDSSPWICLENLDDNNLPSSLARIDTPTMITKSSLSSSLWSSTNK